MWPYRSEGVLVPRPRVLGDLFVDSVTRIPLSLKQEKYLDLVFYSSLDDVVNGGRWIDDCTEIRRCFTRVDSGHGQPSSWTDPMPSLTLGINVHPQQQSHAPGEITLPTARDRECLENARWTVLNMIDGGKEAHNSAYNTFSIHIARGGSK